MDAPFAQLSLVEVARHVVDPLARLHLARAVSKAAPVLSFGTGGYRRTPFEVLEDLWGYDAAIAALDVAESP